MAIASNAMGAEVIARPQGFLGPLIEPGIKRRGHAGHWSGHQGCKKFTKRRATFKAAKKTRQQQRAKR